MEKTNTRLKPGLTENDTGTVPTLSAALTRSLAILARCQPESMPGAVDFSSLARFPMTRINHSARYPLGLHSNVHPELCICLWGKAGMEILDKRFRLSPGDVCYMQPGVIHSEGYLSSSRGYQLMWFCMTPDAVTANCVTRDRAGWRFPFRGVSRTKSACSLAHRLSSLGPDPGSSMDRFESFRALWLSVMTEILCCAVLPGDTITEVDPIRQMMAQVKDHIDHHLAAKLNMDYLARYSGFTGAHLNRLFKKQFGYSVHGYVIHARLTEARRLLSRPGAQVQHVARSVGYDDALYFSKAYRQMFGKPPSLDMV